MRKAFGEKMLELAEKDSEVHLVVGDFGYSIFDEFIKKFPNRFHNLGICEQSMIGVAAGMAIEGLKPYVYTITPFLIERPFEQVKLDIDQQKTNVKLIGFADYPTHGPTHAELDGEKMASLLKNTKSFFPKSADETKEAIEQAHNIQGPCFISLKKAPKTV